MALSESQEGKVVETLVAAHLILGSDGAINVSTPMVDDEGVDLVLNLSGEAKHLLLQVKSRFTLTGKGAYRSQVRRASFNPRKDLYLLFAYFDKQEGELGDTMWLVPTIDFSEKTKNQNMDRKYLVFQTRFNSKDRWESYRVEKTQLPGKIVDVLKRW